VLSPTPDSPTSAVSQNILHDDVIDYANPPQEDERPMLIDNDGLPPENGK